MFDTAALFQTDSQAPTSSSENASGLPTRNTTLPVREPKSARPSPIVMMSPTPGTEPYADALEQYFSDIRAIPLLTTQEEVALAQRIEAGKQAAERLSRERDALEEKDKSLLETFIKEANEAKEHLTNANLRLVVAVAKRLRPLAKGLSLLDLIQEGNRGLMSAAEKFDYRKGYKFSTLAVWWIRHSILRAIENTSRAIRLPVHLTPVMRQLAHTYRDLQQQLKRPPTSRDIAVKLGGEWDEAKVEAVLLRLRQPLSLELPVREGEDSVLGTTLADETTLSPNEYADEQALDEALHEALAQLPEREAMILVEHYGLFNEGEHSLQAIGEALGVTRERVRQLEKRALNKLRGSVFVQEHLHDFAEAA